MGSHHHHFNAYALGPRVGQGSFGTVYLGTHVRTGEHAAVKVGAGCLLVHEARFYELLQKNDKGVCRLYWHGPTGTGHYALVLELLGPSLDELLSACGGRFSINTVTMVARSLIHRLEAIHARGVIHRDIKPQNFMFRLQTDSMCCPSASERPEQSRSAAQARELAAHGGTGPADAAPDRKTLQSQLVHTRSPFVASCASISRGLNEMCEETQHCAPQGHPNRAGACGGEESAQLVCRVEQPPRKPSTETLSSVSSADDLASAEETLPSGAAPSWRHHGSAGGGSPQAENLVTIDFGLARAFFTRSGHVPFRRNEGQPGTARYASINTHRGCTQSRRDDLEAAGYMLIFLFQGRLPWQGVKADSQLMKHARICELKHQIPLSMLCKGMPRCYELYMEYVRGLSFEEDPDYHYLLSLFDESTGLPSPAVPSWIPRPVYGRDTEEGDGRLCDAKPDWARLDFLTFASYKAIVQASFLPKHTVGCPAICAHHPRKSSERAADVSVQPWAGPGQAPAGLAHGEQKSHYSVRLHERAQLPLLAPAVWMGPHDSKGLLARQPSGDLAHLGANQAKGSSAPRESAAEVPNHLLKPSETITSFTTADTWPIEDLVLALPKKLDAGLMALAVDPAVVQFDTEPSKASERSPPLLMEPQLSSKKRAFQELQCQE